MEIRLKTPIYHPSVPESGKVSLGILHDWKTAYRTSSVLTVLYAMLAEFDPSEVQLCDLFDQYVTNRTKFDEIAHEWTQKYASEPIQAEPPEYENQIHDYQL
jgi:ubiquitin-conjugating enzyme E2 D/E